MFNLSDTHAQIEPGRFLYSGDNSIVLQPPARVADDTMELSWSPDGSRLLTFNSHVRPIDAGDTEASSEFTVVRWVRGSHTASTLYSMRVTGKMDLMYHPQWLPTTNTEIQIVDWTESLPPSEVNGVSQKQTQGHMAMLWIDARSGAVKHLEITPYDMLVISPSRPLAVMLHQPWTVKYVNIYVNIGNRSTLTTIRPDGTFGQSFELSPNQLVNQPRWSEDGKRLNFKLITFDDAHKAVSRVASYYDPATGEVRPQSAATSQQAPEPLKPATLLINQPVRQLTEVETSAKVHPLWISTPLKSEHPRLLACADADMGVLAPDGSAVAYRSSGSTWVSELKSITLAQFKQMLIQAEREAAMQRGKNVALATLMYAQDNNETLPGPGNTGSLNPYLSDPDDLTGFNQLYAGGSLSGVASPAETILGTIDGPGGLVVIYIDGHVKWQPQ